MTEVATDDIAWFNQLSKDDQETYLELLEATAGETWELAPKQQYAEALWHKVDWMLYGGAAGGGKTELMIKHANDLSVRVPGHQTLVARQSIPELRRSIILRLKARIVQFKIGARLRKSDGVTSFPYENDAQIECGYLATDEHVANYLSAEYDLIMVDESTLMTDEQIRNLAGRLRTTKRKAKLGARPHLGLFSNPGGVSHSWHYQTFVTPTNYGQRVVIYNIADGIENAPIARTYDAPLSINDLAGDDPRILNVLVPWALALDLKVDPGTELAVAFVPAKATDNPYIDPGYLKYLNTLPLKRRRQLRDGDWDTFDGQYFDEWSRDLHVVRPFEIPDGWQLGRGADFGSAAPWACYWGAWDNDGNCYVYRERYGPNFTPAEQGKQAKDAETYVLANGKTRRERYFATLADPSVFADKRGTGKSIADLWRAAGFAVHRAKNARVAGWQNVRQYLFDQDSKKPRLFVFDTCENLIRTIPLQQHDKRHPEDLNTTLEDHAVDALRYLLSARPIGVKPPRSRNYPGIDERFNKMVRSLAKPKTKRLFN